MKKIMFSVYDVQADIYDRPMMFDNEKVAIGSIRRDIRDMYIRKEITLDALRDRQLRCVGVFDTASGCFEPSELEELNVRMSEFVGDLVMNDEV